MKAKLGHYVQWLREGFLQMLRLHPVEAGLIALGCIGCLVAYETDSDDTLVRLALVPLAFAVALAFNNLAGLGPWRKVYWVCWAPFVPFALWGGLEEWLASEPSFITFGILAPLALLLCRRAVCNKRFVDDIMVWLRSGILAALFANVALGLFSAILFSTTYIFGLEGSWIEHVWIYALILFETFAGPVLFLMMYDRWAGAECRGTRILDVLLNYIVTPALLIYTAILCLYMVKILVTWSLPEGGWPIWYSGSHCWLLRSRHCSRCCRNACTTGSSTVSAWCRCLRSCCSGSASCVVRTNTGLPNRAYTCLSAAG